jgi:hypothetical protein
MFYQNTDIYSKVHIRYNLEEQHLHLHRCEYIIYYTACNKNLGEIRLDPAGETNSQSVLVILGGVKINVFAIGPKDSVFKPDRG